MSRRLSAIHARTPPRSFPRPIPRSFNFLNMEEETSAADAANVPIPSRTTASNTPNSPRPMSPASLAKGIPLPRTPVTLHTAGRLWNPAAGIIFAPTPVSPISPFVRTLATKSRSSKASPNPNEDALAEFPDAGSPQKRTGRRKKSLTDDVGVLETPTEQKADSADGETFLAAEIEEAREDEEAIVEEEEEELEELLEDPGIERVKTPDGKEIIMWKKAPLVYTDETDPHVALTYQCDAKDLEAAIDGNGSFSFEAYINDQKVPPTIHYVTDVEEMEKVSKLFENDKAIGFDMEWVPNRILRPPRDNRDIRILCSVIQIANAERIAIFHLAKFPKDTRSFMAETLKKIIEDGSVLKTGVSVRFDLRRLATLFNIEPDGALEMGEFHSLLFAAQRNELSTGQKLPGSLTDLTKHYLKLPLDKGDVRTSNWSKALDYQQRIYAANDAYASFRLFDAMDQVRRSLNPRPALPPTYNVNHAETVTLCNKKLAEKATKAMAELSLDNTPKKKTPIRVPKDPGPQLEKAFDWVKQYAKTVPNEALKAAVADLRCYALWNEQNLEVDDVAAACRDPPLTNSYVASKILEAIRLEKLPYNPRRLTRVFQEMSAESMRSGRYGLLKLEMNTKLREMRNRSSGEVDQGTVYARLLQDSRHSLDHVEHQTEVDSAPKIRFTYSTPGHEDSTEDNKESKIWADGPVIRRMFNPEEQDRIWTPEESSSMKTFHRTDQGNTLNPAAPSFIPSRTPNTLDSRMTKTDREGSPAQLRIRKVTSYQTSHGTQTEVPNQREQDNRFIPRDSTLGSTESQKNIPPVNIPSSIRIRHIAR